MTTYKITARTQQYPINHPQPAYNNTSLVGVHYLEWFIVNKYCICTVILQVTYI